MSDLFDNISDWLIEQALGDNDISTTLRGLARRLKEGGIPLARMSMGRSVLHPVIGLIDMQWRSDRDHVHVDTVDRKMLSHVFTTQSPFTELTFGRTEPIIADLKDPRQVAQYEIFQQLAQEGLTGYVAFGKQFGFQLVQDNPVGDRFRGACVSFATRRFSGFSKADIEGLEKLVTALCVCTRVHNDRYLVKDMLETYLGPISGDLVLGGQCELGDGQEIDCAIFYSDLRGSLALSQELDTETYLSTVNAYFKCTVNAIAEHGGEVLKLIGDGVLAIFPFDEKNRPPANMCAAALASAREAFARAAHENALRIKERLPALHFGISLHLGQVIYGNVGTQNRLDFTATGPAVGLAARVEALTRDLDIPLLATQEFAAHCVEKGETLPAQRVRDFGDQVALVHYAV